MSKTASNIIGILLAVLSCGLLIYTYETERSFAQIIIAFSILFLPITFMSSINGKVAVFLFTSLLIIGAYICYKQEWYDTGFGVTLAILIGGATYLFRVSKAKTFDSFEYRKSIKPKK